MGIWKNYISGSEVKGGKGSDYTKIETDGTVKSYGKATVWDDVVNSLIGKRLYDNAGKVDYNYTENAIKFQPGGVMATTKDRVIFNLQYPHGAKANGSMRLHIHWEQNSTDKIIFTVQYRIQSNGAVKETSWTEVSANSDDNNVFTYPGSGDFVNIMELANIDMTGAGISATVQFRIARTDSTASNVLVTFADAHVEYDMNGSHEEYVK